MASLWRKFKDWLIQKAIKGHLLVKGRKETHALVDKLFDKIEDSIKDK